MKLVATPITYTVRLYLDDTAEYNVDRYNAVFTIQVMENTAYISGYHGIYNKIIREEVRKWCKENGIIDAVFYTMAGRKYYIVV